MVSRGGVTVRARFDRIRSGEQTVAAGTRGLRFELERRVHLKACIEGWPADGLSGMPYRYFRDLLEGETRGDYKYTSPFLSCAVAKSMEGSAPSAWILSASSCASRRMKD